MISIIIPYNKDRGWLDEAVKSVENQTVKAELILSRSPMSCAVNLQNGLDRVKTQYYSVLAEDDWLSPNFCEVMERHIKEHEADLYYAYSWRHNGKNKSLYRSFYYSFEDLLKSNGIHGGAVCYRTQAVRSVGGYDVSLKTAEEYDLHLRMSYADMRFQEVGYNLYNYRIHSEQKGKTSGAIGRERKAMINEIRNKYR